MIFNFTVSEVCVHVPRRHCNEGHWEVMIMQVLGCAEESDVCLCQQQKVKVTESHITGKCMAPKSLHTTKSTVVSEDICF